VSNQVIKKNITLKQNQIQLEQLLKDKNILLAETHHRVKNNLAVISGIFDLQMFFENDQRINAIMTNAKNRIKSMSLVHESLYSQSIVSRIDFKMYVESLVKELKNSLQMENEVSFQLEIEDIHLDLSSAIPCGLIINEIVTNCFKHAFKDTANPKIKIQMNFNETFTLSIHDNGSGFDSENRAEQNTLGLTLIDALVNQLNGSYSFQKAQGTLINICFKNNDDKRIENIHIS
jgi:two-component sensor histidine kinase